MVNGLTNKFGQEAGICTRTVSFTGRDAANYTTILAELAPKLGAEFQGDIFDWRRTDQFRFVAEPARGTEYNVQPLRRADANDPARLVASAVEQLALITNDRFHRISFLLVIENEKSRKAHGIPGPLTKIPSR